MYIKDQIGPNNEGGASNFLRGEFHFALLIINRSKKLDM